MSLSFKAKRRYGWTWRMYLLDAQEWWSQTWRRTMCRLIGHSKKLERHLHEDLCARCRIVVSAR